MPAMGPGPQIGDVGTWDLVSPRRSHAAASPQADDLAGPQPAMTAVISMTTGLDHSQPRRYIGGRGPVIARTR